MKNNTLASGLVASLLCVVLVAIARASDEPAAAPRAEPSGESSGLKVGQRVPRFYVQAVTGPQRGKSICYVCRNGDRPVVMVFVRKMTPQVPSLLQDIDALIDGHRATGLRGCGVFISNGERELPAQVQTLAFDNKLSMPLATTSSSEGPWVEGIPRQARVSVVLYHQQKVIEATHFGEDNLTAERRAQLGKRIRELAKREADESETASGE